MYVCTDKKMIYTKESTLRVVEETVWISKQNLKWKEVLSNGVEFVDDDNNAILLSTGCVLKSTCMFVRVKNDLFTKI